MYWYIDLLKGNHDKNMKFAAGKKEAPQELNELTYKILSGELDFGILDGTHSDTTRNSKQNSLELLEITEESGDHLSFENVHISILDLQLCTRV